MLSDLTESHGPCPTQLSKAVGDESALNPAANTRVPSKKEPPKGIFFGVSMVLVWALNTSSGDLPLLLACRAFGPAALCCKKTYTKSTY